jgi:WD40 repeat protein
VLWDAKEDFKYETNIKVFNFLKYYQEKIWYLSTVDYWVTTDKTCSLHFWDTKEQKVDFSFLPSVASEYQKGKLNIAAGRKLPQYAATTLHIVDVEEISYLKLVAIATSNKFITIYSLIKNHEIMKINVKFSGINMIKFFESYQVLMIAGYEHNIPVFRINPEYHDLDLVGRLIGHTSIITAILPVENSPLVISCDDLGVIKTWDIRKFQCFQTVKLGSKIAVAMFLDMEYGIGIISKRVSYIKFDRVNRHGDLNSEHRYMPVDFAFNQISNEIVLCCNN